MRGICINDMKQRDGVYRLKRHAVSKFYAWLASWACAISKPSDLGDDDSAYQLPPLTVNTITVDSDYTPEGVLPGFGIESISATEAKRLRRETTEDRVARAVELVSTNVDQWIVWCGLNNEADALAAAIPDSINVHGSMSPDDKSAALERWLAGDVRVLVTKVSIAGFGINMQNCHNVIFCGMDYSWEGYYQAVRRCWRFGQQHPVNVHIIISQQETPVLESVMSKEKEAVKMTNELVQRAAQYVQQEVLGAAAEEYTYRTDEASGEGWRLLLGDSCERINELADASVDLSIFSPPFIETLAGNHRALALVEESETSLSLC